MRIDMRITVQNAHSIEALHLMTSTLRSRSSCESYLAGPDGTPTDTLTCFMSDSISHRGSKPKKHRLARPLPLFIPNQIHHSRRPDSPGWKNICPARLTGCAEESKQLDLFELISVPRHQLMHTIGSSPPDPPGVYGLVVINLDIPQLRTQLRERHTGPLEVLGLQRCAEAEREQPCQPPST